MKMMEHAGTVVEVEDERAVVELEEGERCGSSVTCGCCNALQGGRRRLQVDRNGLKAGDNVQVMVPAVSGYVSVLVVFVLPMVLFIAGILIGQQFEPPGGANGLATIVGGLAGVGVAVLVAMAVNRLLTGGRSNIQVRRVD
jgi:positive regulator of sigma E activity